MSKILKVIIEREDKAMMIEGDEAERWESMSTTLAILANAHGMNPFDKNPIKWKITEKS
jgi:hypothetical protein